MPRKAVTNKAVELDRSRMPVVLAVAITIGVGLTAAAVMWGRSDAGVIDVSATIAHSQYVADNTGEGETPAIAVPSREYVELPNGGLVGTGSETPPSAPTAETPVASSMGTTTDTTASTTAVGNDSPASPTSDQGTPVPQ